MKKNIFQMKIFEELTLFLFIIYSFLKFKALLSVPKSFYGPLTAYSHCPSVFLSDSDILSDLNGLFVTYRRRSFWFDSDSDSDFLSGLNGYCTHFVSDIGQIIQVSAYYSESESGDVTFCTLLDS